MPLQFLLCNSAMTPLLLRFFPYQYSINSSVTALQGTTYTFMPHNPQNPRFSTPFRPLWCQSVKVKVSNCISSYGDMRHFIWLIIIYNILYIIIILYILLFIIIFITFTYNFQLNNPPFKETVKSHPSLIKCQSEFDTLTLTL